MKASNHWPLFGRRLPFHAALGDTADPHAAITCPACRKMLLAKTRVIRSTRDHSAQELAFFASDAAYWRTVLEQR